MPETISTLSLVYARAKVTVIVDGQIYDPTGDTVQMAFLPKYQDPGSGDWKAAVWETAGSGPTVAYYACCLIGPSGTITLGQGTYVKWTKVIDNPEIPVLQSPDLLVIV